MVCDSFPSFFQPCLSAVLFFFLFSFLTVNSTQPMQGGESKAEEPSVSSIDPMKTMKRALLILVLLQRSSLGFQPAFSGLTATRIRGADSSSLSQSKILQRHLCLSAAANGSGQGQEQQRQPNNKRGRNLPNPIKSIKKGLVRMMNARARLMARFQALSKPAKRIVVAYALLVSLVFGGMARNVYSARAPPTPIEVSYSSFLDIVEGQAVDSNYNTPRMHQVRIGSDRILYKLSNSNSQNSAGGSSSTSKGNLPLELPTLNGRAAQRLAKQQRDRPYMTAYTRQIPGTTPPQLVEQLRAREISFAAAPAPRTSTVALAVRTFMVAFYFVILFRLYKTVSGAGGGAGKGETPGKLAQATDLPPSSFDDIQGIDEAKTEVMELVDTLRNPDKYAILGARAPTGLLLVGPPGTGKTMLARATAATAGVPLLYCSGSDFVEMFVGRGAARVRKLFERAEKLSPCIIFVDELDALGKSRDMGGAASAFSRSNDEAEQTLNQLLACMDGLDSSRRICVLAATNRKEVLDPALIRPGRFDRIVKLEMPNSAGREKILRVHTSKLPGFTEGSGVDPNRVGALGKGRLVDLSAIAAVTEGFSGAELEFLVNEAAIRAVRRVSAALQKGTPQQDIVPHVEAKDFEESLRSFYETRKPRGVNDILKNVWRS